MNKKRYTFILILFYFWSFSSYASLLISPTRIVFDQRDRAHTVTVINTGKVTTAYRIALVDNLQQTSGKYQRLKPEQQIEGHFSATRMLRYTPKQVRLKPGERQKVRLSLRKPPHLLPGEYRSHLEFKELPNPIPLDSSSNQPKIQVFMLTGFTIPVLVRHGNVMVTAVISDVKFVKNKNSWYTAVQLQRQGNYSTFGKLNIYWKPNKNSNYQQVNYLNNVTLYREVPERIIQVSLKTQKPRQGWYKIEYVGDKNFSYQVFDEKEVYFSSQTTTKP